MENTKVKTMITAKELFDKMLSENDECTSTEMMIEFAKLHVKESLKQASKKASIFKKNNSGSFLDAGISEDSILKAYSLDNVV